ncbi:MAG: GTP-binding protein [Planctomycetota bacterium]|jgi:signal recognition particle receptor subunit beta
MVQINFASREVQCKIVYYGPARSGKTANLRTIHARSPEGVRGSLTSIQTDEDRTLFFDFLPLNLGSVAGIDTKINLYAVPYLSGQNANRVLVLEGIDGIVFVADSSPGCLESNVEALRNLRENVAAMGRRLEDIPLVFQWNKSDLAGAIPGHELKTALNVGSEVSFAACALSGTGVFAALKAATQKVLLNVSNSMGSQPGTAPVAERLPPRPKPAARAPLAGQVEPVKPATTLAPGRRLPVADSGEEPGPWEDPVDYAEVAMAETGDFEGLPEMPEAAQAAIPPSAPPPEPLPDNPVVEPTPLQTPEAVREAARVLAQPTRPQAHSSDDFEPPAWSPPPPPEPAPPTRRPAPAPPPEPRGPRMVPVGPQRVAGMDWDQEESLDAPSGRRQSPVATERRRGPRIADRKNVAPVSQLVAGAVGTLLSLGVVGYLVVVLL